MTSLPALATLAGSSAATAPSFFTSTAGRLTAEPLAPSFELSAHPVSVRAATAKIAGSAFLARISHHSFFFDWAHVGSQGDCIQLGRFHSSLLPRSPYNLPIGL